MYCLFEESWKINLSFNIYNIYFLGYNKYFKHIIRTDDNTIIIYVNVENLPIDLYHYKKYSNNKIENTFAQNFYFSNLFRS